MRHGILYTLLIFIAIVIVVAIFAWVGVDAVLNLNSVKSDSHVTS